MSLRCVQPRENSYTRLCVCAPFQPSDLLESELPEEAAHQLFERPFHQVIATGAVERAGIWNCFLCWRVWTSPGQRISLTYCWSVGIGLTLTRGARQRRWPEQVSATGRALSWKCWCRCLAPQGPVAGFWCGFSAAELRSLVPTASSWRAALRRALPGRLARCHEVASLG